MTEGSQLGAISHVWACDLTLPSGRILFAIDDPVTVLTQKGLGKLALGGELRARGNVTEYGAAENIPNVGDKTGFTCRTKHPGLKCHALKLQKHNYQYAFLLIPMQETNLHR